MKKLLILTTNDGVKVYEGDVYYAIPNRIDTLVFKKIASMGTILDTSKNLATFHDKNLADKWLSDYFKNMHKKLILTTNDGVEIFEGDTYYYVANEAILLVRKRKATDNPSVHIRLCTFADEDLARKWVDDYYEKITILPDIILDNPPKYHPRNSTIQLQQKFYEQLKSNYDKEIFDTQEWLRDKVYATSIECTIISVTDSDRYCVRMELNELQQMKKEK